MQNNIELKPDNESTKKHLALMSIITTMEDRLKWSELIYLLLDIVVFLFTIVFISSIMHRKDYFLTYIDLSLIFSCIVVGMSINAYWIASSMRAQLKLKLRYFQARSLERMIGRVGEYIFTDESVFFDPDVRRLESHDKKETLEYPSSGLTRMDGFVGSTKPRYFSLLLPALFVIIYWFIFFVVLSRI